MAARIGRLAAVLALLLPGLAAAAPATITIPGDRVFPESITSSSTGAVYIGSIGLGMIWRAAPGAAIAEPFVAPNPDLRSVFGVLADDRHGVLYACTNDWSALGVATPGGKGPATLKAFALDSGKPLGSYPFPGGTGMCNDIAIGPDGAAYVTDSSNPRILRLARGARTLEVWLEDPVFGTQGINLDGIAFGADDALYVTGFSAGKLYRVALGQDRKAGAVTELALSQPVQHPDGMRPFRGAAGTELLLVEGGHLDRVAVEGDRATVTVLDPDRPGAVGVTQVGRTAWVAEGQLGYLFDPTLKGRTPAPFQAFAVALPA